MNSPLSNPLQQLTHLGQSVWLDDIRRAWFDDGTLATLIAQDGVTGVTSNPAVFASAMSGAEYEEPIRALTRRGLSADAIYETLELLDVQRAADLLRPIYDATHCADGFVSLELSPHLAHDAETSIAEARRLWRAFDRPNAMIKVPATTAGLTAIKTLLADGINVNVTLLFGLQRYREVLTAFLAGLDARAAAGQSLDRVASVASFFMSRIDTWVDGKLTALDTPQAKSLRGCAAIAAAQLAYSIYLEWTASARWQRLMQRGARSQRLLWASTSTKDKSYADTKYVEALIGPQTVNTLPYATLLAYRDHGHPIARLTADIDHARSVWAQLSTLGIDMHTVSELLEQQGVQKFIESFDTSLAALARTAINVS